MAWEDSDRPPLELFFEADSEFALDLNPEANAFLLAGILPAFRNGERRLRIEGAICPRLAEGLENAMRTLQAWHDPERRLVAIESEGGQRVSRRGAGHAGLFLTGGVDSLHALWWNRQSYGKDHPSRFRDAIYIEGLSFPEPVALERNLDVTRRQKRAITAIAAASDLTLISLRSNLRMLEPNQVFVAREALTSLLASVGHALSRRLTSVSCAAGMEIARLIPWGSHPLLDPLYCSSAMEFRQVDWAVNRLSKIRRVAPWGPAIENMMVCLEGPLAGGRFNCCQCEKCVRTMVGLEIAGRPEAAAFSGRELTAAMIDRLELIHHLGFLPSYWSAFIDPLKALGREDLSAAVERLVARASRKHLWLEERDWKGAVRKFDRKHLGGALLRVSRRLRGFPASAQTW